MFNVAVLFEENREKNKKIEKKKSLTMFCPCLSWRKNYYEISYTSVSEPPLFGRFLVMLCL